MLGQRRFGKIQMALLVVIALVMGATLISPAVGHVTRKVKHLYKHLDPRYVNIGETVANADKLDNIDSTAFQQKCKDGSVLAFARIDGNGVVTGNASFSTNGVLNAYNCTGGTIEVVFFGTGSYGVRINGITNVNPELGVYLFQSADDHNDGVINIDTHGGDDYIEVDTFDAASGAVDNADFYLIALR